MRPRQGGPQQSLPEETHRALRRQWREQHSCGGNSAGKGSFACWRPTEVSPTCWWAIGAGRGPAGHVGWGSLRVTGPHHVGEESVVRKALESVRAPQEHCLGQSQHRSARAWACLPPTCHLHGTGTLSQRPHLCTGVGRAVWGGK